MTQHLRAIDVSTEGRTLLGRAYQYEVPSRVKDPGTPAYLEEFVRGADAKTLSEHPVLPLLKHHQAARDPIGVATFERTQEGLLFVAPLSKTREADETLELVNDGALRSVSVRFASLKSKRRSSPDGPVTSRLEVALRELSLVTTGFGAHPGAEVLAVRSEDDDIIEGTPRLDVVRRRLILMEPLP